MRTLLYILLLTVALPAFGQDWKPAATQELKAALGKCSELYRAENYSLQFRMDLYKNAGSNDVVTTKGSLIRGKGKQYRSEQPGKLIIQTEAIKLMVDSAQQVAGIIRPDTLFDAVELDQLLGNLSWESLTVSFRSTDREKCYLVSGPGLATYESIEFRLDTKTGYLTGMTLSFQPFNYFSELPSDETVEKPKAVVTYSVPKKITAEQQKLLDVSSWIEKKGDRYELVSSRSAFRLEDYRLPNHY